MRLHRWMLAAAGALLAGGAVAQTSQNAVNAPPAAPQAQPQDGTQERSPTLNNSANRASDPTQGENDRFREVRGGPATPRKEWKKGDRRGKPQKPRVSRKHVQEKLKKQQEGAK